MAGKRERNRQSAEAVRWLKHESAADRADLQSNLVERLRAAEESKWPRALQIFEDAAFLCGNHDIIFRRGSGGNLIKFQFGVDDTSASDRYIPKTYENHILPPYERSVSQMCRGNPTISVEPNSRSPQDQQAAAIADAAARVHLEDPIKLSKLRRDIASIGILCGTAIPETEYGQVGSPEVYQELSESEVPEEKAALFGEIAPEAVEGEERVRMRTGLRASVWTPLHITPDPAAESEESMIWVARLTLEDVDVMCDHFYYLGREYKGDDSVKVYTEALSAVASESCTGLPIYWWCRIQDLIDAPFDLLESTVGNRDSATSGGNSNLCTYYVVDIKPNMQYPRGRTVHLLGGQIVMVEAPCRAWREQQGEDRNTAAVRYDRWHEYAFWRWMTLKGRFWGISPTTQTTPLQKKINAIDAAEKANRDHMAFGQWLVPNHTNLKPQFHTGLPGQSWGYRDSPGRRPPERIQNNPFPAEMLVTKRDAIAHISTIFASTLRQDSSSPSAVRSGVMVDQFDDERMEQKQTSVEDFRDCLELIGQNVLIDLQFAITQDDPTLTRRILSAAPERSVISVESFIGASLRDNTRVKIDLIPEVMRSRNALANRAAQALQFAAQTMTEPQRLAAFDAMGLGDQMRGPAQAAVLRAEWMISQILAGETGVAMLFPRVDQPQIMRPIFQEFILSERFWVTPDDQRQAILGLYDQCAALEQQMMQAQMAAAREQMAMTQGKGGQ